MQLLLLLIRKYPEGHLRITLEKEKERCHSIFAESGSLNCGSGSCSLFGVNIQNVRLLKSGNTWDRSGSGYVMRTRGADTMMRIRIRTRDEDPDPDTWWGYGVAKFHTSLSGHNRVGHQVVIILSSGGQIWTAGQCERIYVTKYPTRRVAVFGPQEIMSFWQLGRNFSLSLSC